MNDLTPIMNPVPAPIIGIAAIGECMLWTGYRDRKGYGTRTIDRRTVRAHRQAWADVHGDPGHWQVLHRCDNPACINVNHLFLGTNADNVADRNAKGRQSRFTAVPGERNGQAKLTADQIREIRASTEPSVALGRRFGVYRGTVSRIRSHKQWAHLQ